MYQDLATLIDKSLANSADLATEIVNIESESELDLDIVPEIADTTTSGKGRKFTVISIATCRRGKPAE